MDWRVAPLPLHLGDVQAGCGGRGNESQEGAHAFSQDGPLEEGGPSPRKGTSPSCLNLYPTHLALQPQPSHFLSYSPSWLLCGALLMGCSRLPTG